MRPIHIVYAADANYCPYAGISICSILRHLSGNSTAIHFHVLSDGARSRDITRIRKVVKSVNCQLSVYDVRSYFDGNQSFLKREYKYLSRTAYSRFYLAEILPKFVDRVLYLDCDAFVRSDIFVLWQLTEQSPALAACPDPGINARFADHKGEIGLSPDTVYFNSGVFIANLDIWRQEKIGDSLIDNALKMPNCRFFEQDVLNVVLAARTMILPYSWNVQVGVPTASLAGVTIACAISDANILHFVGKEKPWQSGYDREGVDVFRDAKRNSPWRYMLPETGIRRAVRRLKRSVAKRFGT